MDVKVCTKCAIAEPIPEFHKDARLKSGHVTRCKACTCAYKKAYYASSRGKAVARAWIERNKEKRSAYNKAYLRQYRAADFKGKRKLEFCLYKGGCCVECGFEATKDTVAAFDFHHVNPSEKEYTPSDMLMLKKEKVYKELDKCVLLCSNCHRILHYRQHRAKPAQQREGVETNRKV